MWNYAMDSDSAEHTSLLYLGHALRAKREFMFDELCVLESSAAQNPLKSQEVSAA